MLCLKVKLNKNGEANADGSDAEAAEEDASGSAGWAGFKDGKC